MKNFYKLWTLRYPNEYECDKCGNDCSGLCDTRYDW